MSAQTDTRPPAAGPAPASLRVAVPAADLPRRPFSGGGLLPPWSRAPLLPFGQPAVILAVLAATLILACAGASAPLFLSSAGSAALQRLSAQACPENSTAAVKRTAPAADLAGLDRRVVPAVTGAGLPAPRLSAFPVGFTSVGAPAPLTTFGSPTKFRLVYRADALAHVTALPGAVGGSGVWLSRYASQRLGVPPGSTVRVGGTPVRLAGYYANFYDAPLPPCWCAYRQDLVDAGGSDVSPPLVLATDPALLARLAGRAPYDLSWVSPVDTAGLTVTRGHDARDRQRAAYAAAGLPPPQDLARRTGGAGVLPLLTDRAVLIRDGLRGPVLPIALGGTLLALLLVGAAGSYWADRRFAEVRLLSARGVGPAALAGKAVLELALPAAAGTVLGWFLAGPAEAAVTDQDARVFDTVDRARIFTAADYLGITWTFAYLTALAGLVGLVSVGALLLYVETRQRSRVASYALGRRMGLTRAVHLRSLLAELGLLLGVAYLVGAGLGRVALGLVHGLLDVDPSRPPEPLLVVPVGVLLGAAAAVAVVTVLTAVNAQRVADRTPPAEVLRLGT